MDDKTAELLEQIEKDFMHRANVDAALTQFWKKAGQRQATQDDVADYAARLGEVLSATLQDHIVPAGDAGKIEERLQQLNVKSMVSHARQIAGVPEEEETEFHKTVKGTVDPMMKRAHTMINRTAAQVQKAIDEANGIGLNSVKAVYPQERIDGLIDKIAAPGNGADEVRQWLGEPVVNNCEKFFDEHVQANAAARFDLGMEPVIVRTAAPGCCDWCAKLAGAYPYDEVRNTGNDVYRRHQYCRCHVIFECDGKRQDVWSKKYYAADEKTLEERAKSGIIELNRKGSSHRRISDDGHQIIDKPTYNKITAPAIRAGAEIRAATDEELELFRKRNVSAATLGDLIIFGPNPTVSDVLEETRHFFQNRQGLFTQYDIRQREIMCEIDAKEFVLSKTKKYNVPNEEVQLTKKQLESYKAAREEMILRGDWIE